jgi:hypothetical protein
MDMGGRAAWGCPLDWISEGDAVGCVRSRGARHGGLRTGGSAPCSRGFDEDVPPVHSDGIRVAAVVVGKPEARTVASRSDGVGADASRLDGLGCGAHTCSSGVGLVVDTGALGMVEGAGGNWGMQVGA